MAATGGRHLIVHIDGKTIECVTIGVLAAAVGRSARTIRGWERSGFIPPAPFVLPGGQNTRRRLYPVVLVAAIKEIAIREGFGRRRPSGQSIRQQQMLYAAWNTALASLNSELHSVTDQGDEWLTKVHVGREKC